MAKKAAKKSAKTTAKKRIRVEYTKADVRELRAHSKARTPVRKIAKEMKRSRRIAAAESSGAWYWARPSPLNGRYNRLNDCSSELNSRSSLVHMQLPTVSHVLKFHRRIP
jgi:hypothetical protein